MPSTETNDAAYLIRIAGGDSPALLALYDRYAPILLALAQHIAGAGAEAEELVHDVFLEVWRHADTYQPQHGTVRSWLIMRTREHALDTLRACPELAAQVNSPHFCPQPADGGEVDSEAFAGERQVAEKLLAGLSQDQRSVLELAWFTGMSQADIASTLRLSCKTVLGHLQAVQQQMRHTLHDMRRL